MDIRRRWILNKDRSCKEYLDGLQTFITAARNHLNGNNECLCPCRKCGNNHFARLSVIKVHIMRFGFTRSYDVWLFHGENEVAPPTDTEVITRTTEDETEDTDDDNVLQSLFEDLGRSIEQNRSEQPFMCSDLNNFIGDNAEKLYPGCKFSVLEVVIRLMHIKVLNRWTDKSFDLLLNFINMIWPNLSSFPSSAYDAKRILREVGLGYEKIDACKNDCCLFWKEHASDEQCYICGESRYKVSDDKGRKIPHKSLRYFAITKRLQRIFGSRHMAVDMRWHKDKRDQTSDALTHPADGDAWKHFDEIYPDFVDDCRNVRLGLAADGFCPFSASYSMWPVIVVPYNMPPWKCMQKQFRYLTLLIPGPVSPGKDIDIYLRPLIEELKHLWSVGVETYDAASNTNFRMHANLMWTINDFPAYGNLSGWSTHGKKACPVCSDDTTSISICSKLSFMGHRRYLALTHHWRRSTKHDGQREGREAPKIKTGAEIFAELQRLPLIVFGKHALNKDHKRKRAAEEGNWTKKSIFFELPYWSKSKLPHNLDVMHIEKNIHDNIFYTMLNTKGRTKDTEKARIDLERMNIKRHLHLITLPNGKVVKPAASYVLKPADRTKFLQFITSVKFPDGYAANLSRGVNVKEGKIHGLKTHDCHVLLQRLIPIAIRAYLPKDVCSVLIELSVFFQRLTSKSLRRSELDELQDSIVLVLCKLERIYPPAFFDVMVHLSVHLVREVRLGGPVSCRWMYPFERDMGVYKKYVRNRAHPEGSIAEAYSINEALTFCGMYFDDSETQFARPERNKDEGFDRGTLSVFAQRAKPFGAAVLETWSKKDIDNIHWAILNNCEELKDFVNDHMQELERESPENLLQRQREDFSSWFEQHVKKLHMEGPTTATEELYALSQKPNSCIHSYTGCIVNGVRFRIKERDSLKNTQNSGVSVYADHDEDEVDYYGHLTKVVVLNYILDYKVVVFKCVWYNTDPRKNMIKRHYHFKSVNTKHKWYEDDPYILAMHAKQVFYVDDPKLGGDYKIVQEVEQRQVWDVSEKEDGMDCDEAYQQNESTLVDFVPDPDDDSELANDDHDRRDTESTNLSQLELERLRRSPLGTNNYDNCLGDDDSTDDDSALDDQDDNDDDS